MEHRRVAFGAIPWEQPAPGVRFKAWEQDDRRLRLAEFTRDFVEPEWCTKGHVGYVLEGTLELDFHGEKIVFRAGDGLFIPSGGAHRHKARALTDLVRVFLVESTNS